MLISEHDIPTALRNSQKLRMLEEGLLKGKPGKISAWLMEKLLALHVFFGRKRNFHLVVATNKFPKLHWMVSHL